MSLRSSFLAIAILTSCTAAAPPVANVPPTGDGDVGLSDGRTLHERELPLGRLDGVVLDGARFDSSNSRVAFLATFPNGAVDGDWHRARPTQAYVADLARRTLTALTSDGAARSIRWQDATHLEVLDGSQARSVAVAGPGHLPARMQISAVTPFTSGSVVTPDWDFRLQVLKRSDGSYAVGQVGAVRLRTIAVARDGRSALVGSFVAWIDGSKNGGAPFSRNGPDDVQPMSFSGSAYGDALTHVLPLGHLVYQGAYRNGVAYLAFTVGLKRVVAATSDFVNYSYPSLPQNPDFTIGDGMGAGADGILYFADPENRVVQTWKDGRYVERAMTFPDGVSDVRRLFGAMTRLSPGFKSQPPMEPDSDALDNALLEWRMYPVGDVTGSRWIASYLGQPYVANSDLHFHAVTPPVFPFAVLGRTDDGRLWGAAPLNRSFHSNMPHWERFASSTLFSSRDGSNWSKAGTFGGSLGAVGLHDGRVWVAMSAPEPDGSGVEISTLNQTANPAQVSYGAPTGAIYSGEDLVLADINAGLYVICGAEPGTRLDDQSGPLAALRLDPTALFTAVVHDAPEGPTLNVFLRDRLQPSHRPVDASGLPEFLIPSQMALRFPRLLGTIVNDAAPLPLFACCRLMTSDEERLFELEYAWVPYPLERVSVQISGDSAIVRRTSERGPLWIYGSTERWSRNGNGSWHLSNLMRSWHI